MKTKKRARTILCMLVMLLALVAMNANTSTVYADTGHTIKIGTDVELKHGKIGIHWYDTDPGETDWYSSVNVSNHGVEVERQCQEEEPFYVMFRPDSGYRLSSRSVKAQGGTIEGSENLIDHWNDGAKEGDVYAPTEKGDYIVMLDGFFEPADGKREVVVGQRTALSNGKIRIEKSNGSLVKEFTQEGDCLVDKGSEYKLSFIGDEGYELDEKEVVFYSKDDGSDTEVPLTYDSQNDCYTFTVPSADDRTDNYQILINAKFKEIVTYQVTVNGGTADKASATEGESVTITANEPATGKSFTGWTVPDGLTFTEGDATTTSATFTMPAQAVEVTANFESEWQALQREISNASDGATITLSKNMTALADDTHLVIPGYKKLTIDLNGHTLDRGLSSKDPVGNGEIMYLNQGATLTLTDGKITGGSNMQDGGAINMYADSTLNMTDITMENNYSDRSGGAINDYSNVNLTRCNFAGNSCKMYGGAIYIDYLSYLTMEDCVFTNNYTTLRYSTYAGAIHGIYTEDYYGDLIQGATIKLSGSLTIDGDQVDVYSNNLYLGKNGIVVDITGPLTNTKPIPVSVEDNPSGKNVRVITSGLAGNGSDKNFTSENSDYDVVMYGEGAAAEAALAAKSYIHKVTLAGDLEHGNVTVDKDKAVEGDVVTLTVPDSFYETHEFTVKTESGEDVSVTNNKFTMPAEDVIVTVESLTQYNVNIKEDLKNGTVTVNKDKAAAGATVTVTATPELFCFVDQLYYKTASGETVFITNNKFTMPAEDVTIYAVFGRRYQININGKQLALNYLSNDEEGWSYVGDESGGTLTLKDANISSDADYAIYINIAGTVNIVLDGENTLSGKERGISADSPITIKGPGTLNTTGKNYGILSQKELTISDKAQVTASGGTQDGQESVGISARTGLTISGGANITATGAQYGIEILNSKPLSITNSTVTATAENAAGIGIVANNSKITISGSNVTATGSKSRGILAGSLEISGNSTVDATGASYAVMAEGSGGITLGDGLNVKTPDLGKVSGNRKTIVESDGSTTATHAVITAGYQIAATNDGNGTASADPAFAETGDTVTLTAAPNDEDTYRFKEWEVVSGGVTIADPNSANTTFEVGTANVEVKAIFEQGEAHNINIAENIENGTVSADKSSTIAGVVVTLTATPDEECGFNGFTVTKASGGTVPVTNNKFTMPDEDVTVTASFVPNTYGIWINGTQLTSKYKSNAGEGWSYAGNAGGGTLTLSDANINGQRNNANIFISIPVTIVLEGNNTLSEKGTGIYASSPITIKGGGTLNASGSNFGISVQNGLTISDSANIIATGGTIGINVDGSGPLSITDSTVKATGNGPVGIYAKDNVTISDSEVTAIGNTVGISASNANVTVSGSEVTATGNELGISAKALDISNNSTATFSGNTLGSQCSSIDITDSKVTATGTTDVGLYASGKIKIHSDTAGSTSGSTVDATGGKNALLANEGITLEQGMNVKTPTLGKVKTDGKTIVESDDSTVAKHAVITAGYNIVVTDDGNGTASANPVFAKTGETVTLTAAPTDSENYRFKEWEVVSGGVTIANSANTTFEVGTDNVEVKANFEQIPTMTLTVNGNSDTKTYNGKAQTFEGTVTATCTATTGDVTFDSSKFSYSGTTSVIGTKVGDHEEKLDLSKCSYSDSDYKVEWVAGDPIRLTIEPAQLTITAKNQTYEYDGKTHGPGDAAYDEPAEIAELVEVEGLQGDDSLTSIVLDGQGQEIGTYELMPGGASINGDPDMKDNYKITYIAGTLIIAEKTDPAPTPAKVNDTPLTELTAKGETALTIGWLKVEGAAGYDIFFSQCNHNKKKVVCRNVKNVKGNNTFKWTKSGLKKGTAYKAYVKAYVMQDGKKKYVNTSPIMHAYTGNGTKKYTNARSVSVNKTKVSLKKGKTFRIRAKVRKVKKNKRLMPKGHAPKLRYLTSDSKVATVSKSGRITAKGKGTCEIYVFAHNGVHKTIKVTVR